MLRVLLALLIFVLPALAGPERLDPFLRALVNPEAEPVRQGLVALAQLPPDGDRVRVFLKAKSPEFFSLCPGEVRAVLGNLGVVELPFSQILALSEHPEVQEIRASRPVYPLLDRSVPEIGAPALWYGSTATTGEGVIVGIVDTGVDILHPAFRVDRNGDGSEEGSRILFYWDQTAGGIGWFPGFWGDDLGESPYGKVFSRADLEMALQAGFSPAPDEMGHGTHVAGIVAGDGSAGPSGVAPGSDLVVVKSNFTEDGVVDGIRFVFEAAEALGKPAVVNLSLGGHSGPHDGTGPFEQVVSALVNRPGQAVVVAAGNEGKSKIHVGEEIRSSTTWTLVASSTTVVARFWHESRAGFTFTVLAPTGETMVVLPGQAQGLTTSAGTAWLDNSPSPGTTQEVFLTITGASSGSAWRVKVEPIFPSRLDGWVESASMGYFAEGDGKMTIAEPGNALRVITVAAYVTKTSWTSEAGEQHAEGYEVGSLAPFSSQGPTRDGRLKPDLAAPGAWIASARSQAAAIPSSFLLPGGDYQMLAGTSMAAPHVAGAAALLLSLRPQLTWEEIRAALAAGARVDAKVGAVPNASFGAGKLDVLKAWASLGTPSHSPKPWLAALENPVSQSASFRYSCPEGTASAELRIYDLLGRLIALLPLDPRSELARWDLRTSGGARAASGLYLAILITDSGSSDPVRLVVQR